MPDLSVNYAHLWDSVVKGGDSQGIYYRVSYVFDNWADSDSVANQFRGYSVRIGGSSVQVPPHQYPLSPNFFCTDVEIEGLGAPSLNAAGYPQYDGGFIAHATYRAYSWIMQSSQDPNNDHQIDPANPIVWATQELDFDTETYVHEKNQYKWSTGDALDGKLTGIPVKVSVGITTMTITFHQLPYLPATLIRQKRNTVNSAQVLGVDPGKLLFKGGKTIRDWGPDGTITQKVQLMFQEREVEWNKFLRRDKLSWDYIEDASGNRVFAESDHTPLLAL